MDDAEHGLGVGAVRQALFAVRSERFEVSDFFGHFNVALGYELLLQVAPVFARSLATDQNLDDINNGKPPFVLMQGFTDAFAFKHGRFGY